MCAGMKSASPDLSGRRDRRALRHGGIPLGETGECLLHRLHAHLHREKALNLFSRQQQSFHIPSKISGRTACYRFAFIMRRSSFAI